MTTPRATDVDVFCVLPELPDPPEHGFDTSIAEAQFLQDRLTLCEMEIESSVRLVSQIVIEGRHHEIGMLLADTQRHVELAVALHRRLGIQRGNERRSDSSGSEG